MTAYELKDKHLTHHPDSHFFDAETLKFFGERMSEMRVLKEQRVITDYRGVEHTCYVLSSLQRNHPNGATRAEHYFDTVTFDMILV